MEITSFPFQNRTSSMRMVLVCCYLRKECMTPHTYKLIAPLKLQIFNWNREIESEIIYILLAEMFCLATEKRKRFYWASPLYFIYAYSTNHLLQARQAMKWKI